MGEGLTADVYISKGALSQPSKLTFALWFLRSNAIVLLPVWAFVDVSGGRGTRSRNRTCLWLLHTPRRSIAHIKNSNLFVRKRAAPHLGISDTFRIWSEPNAATRRHVRAGNHGTKRNDVSCPRSQTRAIVGLTISTRSPPRRFGLSSINSTCVGASRPAARSSATRRWRLSRINVSLLTIAFCTQLSRERKQRADRRRPARPLQSTTASATPSRAIPTMPGRQSPPACTSGVVT